MVVNSVFVRINRCLFTGFTLPSAVGAGPGSPQDTLSPAIGIAGFVWDAAIRDNFFNNVKVGIGPASQVSPQAPAPFFAYAFVENNRMVCSDAGVLFADLQIVASFLEVSFADNAVASPIGIQLHGSGLDVAIERNSFVVNSKSALVAATVNAAVVCGASQARISNNQISGASESPGRDGIVLDGTTLYGTQVVGNHINGLTGTGILVKKPTLLLETIVAQNQVLQLGGAGFILEQNSKALDLKLTGNSLAQLGLTSTASPDMAGIKLAGTAFNVDVIDNVIEVVGPDPNVNSGRVGVELIVVADARLAGNRIVDIGPPGAISGQAGIILLAAIGRVDIVDNEVRRASIPPANSTDTWQCSALFIGIVLGQANVCGNLLESFGSLPTAMLFSAPSCIFSNNQCFLDNSGSAPLPRLVVLLGMNAQLPVDAIIASGNFVQGPPGPPLGGPPTFMSLNPTSVAHSLTVLGNITPGGVIEAGGSLLAAPWDKLNATS